MAVLIESAIIALVLAMGTALLCFTSRKRFRSYTALGMLALVYALYNLTYLGTLYTDDPSFSSINLFLSIWVAGMFLVFLSISILRNRIPSLGTSLLLTSLFSVIPFLPGVASNQIVIRIAYPLLSGSITLYCAWLLYRESKCTEDSIDTSKIKLLLVGVLICFAFAVGDFLRRLQIPAPAFGSLITAVFLVLLYRLVPIATLKDLRELVINGVRAMVFCLGISLVYLIVAAWARTDTELFFLNTFLASLILMFCLAPTRDGIEDFFLKHFFYDKQVLFSAIHTLKTAITESETPQMLLHLLRQSFTKSLRIETVHAYLIGKSKEVQRLHESDEKSPSPPLDRESPIIKFLERFKVSLNVDQLRFELKKVHFRRHEEELFFMDLVQRMEECNFSVVLPMFGTDDLIGLIAFENPKTKSSAEAYQFSREEIRMLENLSEQIARQLQQFEYLEKLNVQARLAILGEMSAALAHEIKNPLAAVKGAASCVKNYTDLIKREKFLNIISDEVDRLDLVVNQFLNVAKQPDLAYQADVNAIIEKCLLLAEADEKARNVQIEAKIEKKPLLAAIDPLRLEQVMLNLMNNAIEAIGGPGKIVLRANSEDSMIRIEVSDTGPGMDSDTLAKIFVPFFTTKATGSGLGLTISHNIVSLFGGKLTADSEPGKGTTFTIELKAAS